MSEYVHVVCEGETDFIVIEAAMTALFPGANIVLTLIHPDTSEAFRTLGDHGGGWNGVRNWCQRILPLFGISSKPKALILHVDADVADDPEVHCAQVCPPPSATTTALRAFVAKEWCAGSVPEPLVFCTPSKNIEAWVLQALYPSDKEVKAGIECRLKPEKLLAGKPAAERMVRLKESEKAGRKTRKYKKDPAKYRARQSDITAKWSTVRAGCSEADRFSKDLLAKVA
jgi:hypothetical protein